MGLPLPARLVNKIHIWKNYYIISTNEIFSEIFFLQKIPFYCQFKGMTSLIVKINVLNLIYFEVIQIEVPTGSL
jgi:hypothetical protein